MCFTIFVFLAKTGTMTLKSMPAARQPLYLQLNLRNSKILTIFASYLPLNTTHVVAKCYS